MQHPSCGNRRIGEFSSVLKTLCFSDNQDKRVPIQEGQPQNVSVLTSMRIQKNEVLFCNFWGKVQGGECPKSVSVDGRSFYKENGRRLEGIGRGNIAA